MDDLSLKPEATPFRCNPSIQPPFAGGTFRDTRLSGLVWTWCLRRSQIRADSTIRPQFEGFSDTWSRYQKLARALLRNPVSVHSYARRNGGSQEVRAALRRIVAIALLPIVVTLSITAAKRVHANRSAMLEKSRLPTSTRGTRTITISSMHPGRAGTRSKRYSISPRVPKKQSRGYLE